MNTNDEQDDPFLAGQLIQWGLRVKERPALQPEYKLLIDRYQDRTKFQMLVNQFAAGLGMKVLSYGEHGLVLAPSLDSVFALKGASFRTGRSDADERLLDGLVQVAIAATVFPTPQELDEDATVARPPVTAEEVDETLRRICDRLADEAKQAPDLAASEEEAGLYEAWRVYDRRLSADHRSSPRTTRKIIERNLTRLHELGCFVQQRDDESSFQATWRYHTLVRELAATSLYQRIQQAVDAETATVTEDD